ncbi:MAG: hypothetical protein K8T26_16775 [Lentisphaerae bacterium]|nr:hypothetical protein [Lentisphaerota bacterium]
MPTRLESNREHLRNLYRRGPFRGHAFVATADDPPRWHGLTDRCIAWEGSRRGR